MARFLVMSGVLLAAASLSFAGDHKGEAKTARAPLPTDWTHRHVVFSQPKTPRRAARVQQDERYELQQQRIHARNSFPRSPWGGKRPPVWRHRRIQPLRRDWAVNLGAGASVGAGKYPAKYSFDITQAACGIDANPDFIVYGTGVPGVTLTQGSIVAFTNLYSGCPTGPVPDDYWSYNTGGTVNTSPVFSRDGTQIAFTQTAEGSASLVLLKWKAFDGQIDSPTDLTPVQPSDYPSCIAPCMTTMSLSSLDTNSSVFYSYAHDIAYVGDDSGSLHQFTGVFKGTPTEIVDGTWPVPVSGGLLTSPVHDLVTNNVFVADSSGFLYSVDPGGVVTTSSQLDFGSGFVEGPVLDSSIGAVYVFASDDSFGAAAVYQLSTTLTDEDTGAEILLGASTTLGTPVFDGGFDNNYLTSRDATGNLYVCGNPGGVPTLYQVAIWGGVMQFPLTGPSLGNTAETQCSAVTDVYNPNVTAAGNPQEWVYVSVPATGAFNDCGAGCVMSLKVTQWQPSTVYNSGQEILDNHFNIQVAENSGSTSGATPPTWGFNRYDLTVDGGVHWRNQGALNATTPLNWAAFSGYFGTAEILDPSGNIELAQLPGGTSGGSQPAWGPNVGDTTSDGTITWVNLGPIAAAALPAAGGTSGIVIDNVVDTITGASQIYFSTLQDQSCPTRGGTGGCAVQASQQALQ